MIHTRVWSKNSCGFAQIVFQQPPKPFTTLHWAFALWILVDCRKEQSVALALMIPLVMIMRYVLRQHMAERRFPKQHQPRQTLFFDRSHPPLRVGVEIRRPRRQWHTRHPGCVDDVLKRRAVFPISVMEEILPRREEAPLFHGHVARHLHHPGCIGMRCHPSDLNLSAPQ